FLAWTIIHYIIFRAPVKIVCTAPTSSQLFDALASEVKSWINKLPSFLSELLEVTSDRIVLKSAPEDAFVSFRTSRAELPEALQGVHAKFVMLIADEASGIPEQVFEAARGSMSTKGAITLLTGNPTRANGFFYKTHNINRENWVTYKVACADSTQVDPLFIEEIAKDYGEDSNVYRIRVLGEFPRTDDDTVIPLHLVEDARDRDVEIDPGASWVWGLDVSRFGDDKTVLIKRHGRIFPEMPMSWQKMDLMQTVGRVKVEYDRLPPSHKPIEILVDVIGIGGGVVDRLRELGLPAVGINVSEAPALGTVGLRLRDELWLKAKAYFEERRGRIPADEELIMELAAVTMEYTSAGKIKVESKEHMKKRGLKSPNKADAFNLCFATEAAIASGSSQVYGWDKDINEQIDIGWVP
ncbi:MAG: terminase large subunit domain-containing protein, partial [Pseudomonadales bacterium]